MSLAFIENYKAVRARLNNPRIPKVVPTGAILSRYRLAYDSNPPPSVKKRITIRQIISEVSEKRGVSRDAIISARRNVNLVLARWEVMWRAREETALSLPQIGRALGDRDHTTILYGVRRHQERIDAGEIRP